MRRSPCIAALALLGACGGDDGAGVPISGEERIAVGGVRTPPVDVPALVLTGEPGPSGEIICILSGSTLPMTPERLAG